MIKIIGRKCVGMLNAHPMSLSWGEYHFLDISAEYKGDTLPLLLAGIEGEMENDSCCCVMKWIRWLYVE
jgi:hypothetical protein